MPVRFLIGVFLATSVIRSQGREFIIERLSLEQGLSQSVVDVIHQDSRGFLWFGTQDGLNRYDGYSFVVFKHEPGNPNTLPANSITAIFEDRRQKLWVGTLDGLSMIDGQTITNYINDPNNPETLLSRDVTAVGADSGGNILVGTSRGLQRLDVSKGTFTRVAGDRIRSIVYSIRADSKGRTWIGTGRGLFRFANGDFHAYFPDPTISGSISDTTVVSILEDRTGRLWFGTRRGGLNLYDEKNDRFSALKKDEKNPTSLPTSNIPTNNIPTNNIVTISEDLRGRLWLGSFGDGLILYDHKSFKTFNHDPKDPSTISDNEISKVYCDRSGAIWAGTSGGGVNKIKENKFTVYRSDPHTGEGLASSDIWGIYEDRNGRLWIGTYEDGVNVIDKGAIVNLRNEKGNPRSLVFNSVYCFFEDRAGQMWIGTDRGISRRSPSAKLGVFHNIVKEGDSKTTLTDNSILQVFQDSEGNIWISTLGGGLNFLSADQVTSPTPSFVQFRRDTANSNSLSDDVIFAIAEDRRGHLWFGTQNGLNEYDGQTFKAYRKQPNNPNSLSHNSVMSLCVTDDGLWIGTQGGGLNLLKDGNFTVFSQKEGLPNNVIYYILPDDDGNLWMSTNKGLSRFTPGRKGREAFRNYDTDDGLPSNEFNQGSAFKSKSGILYFGGIAGVVAVNPKDLMESPYAPPVYLTAFRKFDKEVDFMEDFSGIRRIEISYKENFFGFDFVALDYRSPHKNQYAYQLEGFDEDWVFSNSRRYASYTNIDGGSYTFKVKATNSDGVWGPQVAEIRLVVHPPFWKTLWFQFSTGCMVLIAAYSFYQNRMRHIKLRNVLLEKKVHERTKEIEEKSAMLDSQNKELEQKNAQIRLQQAQIIQSEKLSSLGRLVSGVAHEINNPLNYTYGSSANLEVDFAEMLVDIDRQLKAGQISETFGGELRKRIAEMQEMVQAIKRGSTRIKDVVVGLRDFSTSDDAAPSEIDLNVNLDYVLSLLRSRDRKHVTILKELSDVPKIKGFPGHFNQAVMNVLINAIEAIDRKHYEHNEGVIRLKTSVEDGFAVVTVIDNGGGIPESIRDKIFEPFFTTKEVGKGTGLGLATVYGIVHNHGGKIAFDSTVGQGTEFRLYFPLGN